jgi:hypothetical protein
MEKMEKEFKGGRTRTAAGSFNTSTPTAVMIQRSV